MYINWYVRLCEIYSKFFNECRNIFFFRGRDLKRDLIIKIIQYIKIKCLRWDIIIKDVIDRGYFNFSKWAFPFRKYWGAFLDYNDTSKTNRKLLSAILLGAAYLTARCRLRLKSTIWKDCRRGTKRESFVLRVHITETNGPSHFNAAVEGRNEEAIFKNIWYGQ